MRKDTLSVSLLSPSLSLSLSLSASARTQRGLARRRLAAARFLSAFVFFSSFMREGNGRARVEVERVCFGSLPLCTLGDGGGVRPPPKAAARAHTPPLPGTKRESTKPLPTPEAERKKHLHPHHSRTSTLSVVLLTVAPSPPPPSRLLVQRPLRHLHRRQQPKRLRRPDLLHGRLLWLRQALRR